MRGWEDRIGNRMLGKGIEGGEKRKKIIIVEELKNVEMGERRI